MGTIRTVLGDVPAEAVGMVDAHDHLIIQGGPACVRDPDLRIAEIGDALNEAEHFRRHGGKTIVDAMPAACGRDVAALAEVSKKTGVHVIATTGFHKQEYYDELSWPRRYPVDYLIRVLVDECTLGVDQFDNAGPIVNRLPIRPGLLKLATGYNAIRPMEERVLIAVAQVHQQTGLPIITHADMGTEAMPQLDALMKEGVPANAVAICHLDRRPDATILKEVLDRGASVVFDGAAREQLRPVSDVMRVVQALIQWGYGDRLMFGGDIAFRSYRLSQGGVGIAGAMLGWVQRLTQEGVDAHLIHRFMQENPQAFLSLRLK